MSNSKITSEHLARNAIVYIRQSTPHQVVNNLTSVPTLLEEDSITN